MKDFLLKLVKNKAAIVTVIVSVLLGLGVTLSPDVAEVISEALRAGADVIDGIEEVSSAVVAE